MNNKQDLFKIVSSGKYYYPAYTHYSLTPVNVRCDFCSKSNLECAIGFEDKDLCLNCVEILANENNLNNPNKLMDIYKQSQQSQQSQQQQPQIMTKMMQDSVIKNPPQIITRMMQDSVRRYPSNISNMTYMMQDSVRRNPYNIDTITFMMQDSVRSDYDSDDDFEYDKKIKPYNF